MGANDSANINIGGDSSKAQKAYDALIAKNAKLEASTEKMAAKLKKSGKDGVGAFSGISKEVSGTIANIASVGAVLGGVMKELNAISDKVKQIKALKDQTAIDVDKSMTKIFLEGNITNSNMQDELTNKAFNLSKRKGTSHADVVNAMSAIKTSGGSSQDILNNKYDSLFDMANATGFKNFNDLVDLQTSGLKRYGLEDTRENREKVSAKLTKGFGAEIGEAEGFMAKLPKNVSLDQGMGMYNLAKDYYGGNAKKAMSATEKAFDAKGGGMAEFFRSTKSSASDLKAFEDAIKNQSMSEFQSKKGTYSSSLEAMGNRLDTSEKQIFYDKNRVPDSYKRKAYELANEQDGSYEARMRNVNIGVMDSIPLTGLMDEETKQRSVTNFQSTGRANTKSEQDQINNDLMKEQNRILGNMERNSRFNNNGNKPIDMKSDQQLNVRVKK